MSRLNIIIAFILLVCSCKKKEDPKPVEPIVVEDPAPTACFNADNYFQFLFKPINFTNCSENYERAEWNFGNGASAVISDPTIVYGVPGIYNVTLKTFKGTRTAQITKKVVAANSVRMSITLKYSNLTTKDDEKYEMKINYRNKKDNVYHYLGNGVVSLWNASTTHNGFDAPDPNHEFIFVVIFEKKTWDNQNNVLSRDTLFTDVINVFNGVKTPTGSKILTAMKVDYELRMDYKE